ncbi:hypothetical protein BGZ51_004355 [Haplosporangium sp. Z 767]|nr:hypothetical protein BGZ51_004355 [Haplosporangium sp. Z 767]
MAQPKTHRVSLQYTPGNFGTPPSRTQSSSSLASVSFSTRPRRININLPKHTVTSAAFVSSETGESSLSPEHVEKGRARYEEQVAKNATSEAILKMPNVTTKPRSIDDIPDFASPEAAAAVCKLPSAAPSAFSNVKVSMDQGSSFSGQRPGLDPKRSSQHTARGSFGSSAILHDTDKDRTGANRNKRSSSMNPLAATFTPTFTHKSTFSDRASSDSGTSDSLSQRELSRQNTSDSRDTVIAGLGISSLTQQSSQGSSIYTGSSPEHSVITTATSAQEFDPEEFGDSLVRRISDKLETGLDRHLNQLVNATTSAGDTSAVNSNCNLSSTSSRSSSPRSLSTVATMASTNDDPVLAQLKKALEHTNAELDRLKEKNHTLLETNHRLERQHLEATHQVARLQDFENHHQFLASRVKELEANESSRMTLSGSTSSSSLDMAFETASMNGHRQSAHHGRHSSVANSSSTQHHSQQIQRLQRELEALTLERDALKIKSWELERKSSFASPFTTSQRSPHFIDLENERNRLLEELSQKTVAMEELYDKNEALTLRAKEYEKRVWELESQVATLESEIVAMSASDENSALLLQMRSDLQAMEARVVAADVQVERLQAMEGSQVALVKSLQERIQELETTNAELDHSNRDFSEQLNIANNQHALLTKEFESFRSKDKDDRRIEYLTTRNRELELLLQEQNKAQPEFKEEYERVSAELEKIKIRMPQLEGQAKQVALLRSKTLQLEKQIKTMEMLEPRLEEMQQLHERNLFLESELGELEQLRAREMELELELGDTKARLVQLEMTNKSRMSANGSGSFSGLRQVQQLQQTSTRARSGSVAQQSSPFVLQQLQQHHHQQTLQDEIKDNTERPALTRSNTDLRVRTTSGLPHRSQHRLSRTHSYSVSSMDAILSPKSPRRECSTTNTTTASIWPSGRSSMILTSNNNTSNATHRMSTSSSTSSSASTVVGGNGGNHPLKSLQFSAPVSPRGSVSSSTSSSTLEEEEKDKEEDEQVKKAFLMTAEPECFEAPTMSGTVV